MFDLLSLATLLGLVVVILCIGRAIQSLIQPTSQPLLDLLLSFAFGSGFLIVLMYIFGWLGILTPLAITMSLLLLFGLTAKNLLWIWTALSNLDYSWIRQKRLIFAVLFVFGAVNFIGALAPTTDSDGLGYHLAIPKYYLETGGFSYHPMIASTWPLSSEMLYTIGIALSGDVLAKLIHYLFGILCAVAIYWVGRELLSHDHGIVAAALFYTIPLVAIESGIAYNDLFMTFYFVLGFGFWIHWIKDSSSISLPTAAILLGISASSKWNGPISVVILTVMSIWLKWSEIKSAAVPIIQFVCFSAFFPSLWYLKNAILNGNPFGPFLEGIFDGINWTAANTDAYIHSVKSLDLSILHFFIAPIKLFLQPGQYGELTFLGPLLLMLFPVGIYLWRCRDSSMILCYAVLSYIVWWGTSQQSRLLIPILALVAIVSSVAVLDIRLRNIQTPLFCMILISFILSLAFPVAYHGKAVPYVIGLEDRDMFLERIRPVYPAMQFVNSETPATSSIVMLGEIHAYWLDRPYLYECAAMQGIIDYDLSSIEIYSRMKSIGITHLILNHNVRFCPGMEEKLAQEPFLSNLHATFNKNNVDVVTLS